MQPVPASQDSPAPLALRLLDALFEAGREGRLSWAEVDLLARLLDGDPDARLELLGERRRVPPGRTA